MSFHGRGRSATVLALGLELAECLGNELAFLGVHDVQRESLDVCLERLVQPAKSDLRFASAPSIS